jgi:hypothetical protein
MHLQKLVRSYASLPFLPDVKRFPKTFLADYGMGR